jgi:hypothetical protein
MTLPVNRTTLKEWCLRKLGQPVIRVNVDPQQVDDRICEAIDYFQSYHFDGIERLYVSHEITGTKISFTAPIVGLYTKNEIVEGQTSGAKARVVYQSDDNTFIIIHRTKGTFQDGESVLGLGSAVTATIDEIELGDADRGYIELPDGILSVKRTLPLKSGGNYLFDAKYHFALNTLPSLMGFDLISFDMFQKHLSLLDHLLTPKPGLNFNRVTNRLYINIDWNTDVTIGDLLILEVSAIVNPEDYPKIYGNEWVRNYSVALIRQQWAQNLGKYKSIQLLGNVTLDADTMKREAEEELSRLREELERKFTAPAKMLVG